VAEDLLDAWNARLDALRGWNPLLHLTALCAFNANTDLVRRATAGDLADLLRVIPEGLRAEVAAALDAGRGTEVTVESGVEAALADRGPFTSHVGGQAALAAEVLTGLGARSILLLGGVRGAQHFVFEFGTPHGDRRLILAGQPPVVGADPDLTQAAIDSGLDAAFLSGFHRMAPDVARGCARHFLKLRTGMVPVHLELTALRPASRDAIRGLVALSDSLGGSEQEMRDLLEERGAFPLFFARLRTFAKDNLLARVHMHLEGVQVAVVEASREEERRALLVASKAAAETARTGTLRPSLRDGVALRAEDLARFRGVVDALGGDPETGFVGEDGVVVPSPRVESPVRVVGLGDVLSSMAFFARARHLKGRAPHGLDDDRGRP